MIDDNAQESNAGKPKKAKRLTSQESKIVEEEQEDKKSDNNQQNKDESPLNLPKMTV